MIYLATFLILAAVAAPSFTADIGCVEVNSTKHCYVDNTEIPLSWLDAGRSCQINGGRLAVPDASNGDSLLRKYLTKLEDSSVHGIEHTSWIGVTELNDTAWKWYQSKKEFNVTSNDNLTETRFSTASKYFENCATISRVNDSKLLYESQLCRKKFPYICQQPVTPSNCTSPSIQLEGFCFTLTTNPVTWFEAISSCASKSSTLAQFDQVGTSGGGGSGYLGVVTGAEKNWVGLRRQPWVSAGNGDVQANEANEIKQFYWLSHSQPELALHKCVAYYVSPNEMGWRSDNCEMKRNYICQYSTAIHNTTATPSTDQNNFSVFLVALCSIILLILLFVGLTLLVKSRKGYEDIKKKKVPTATLR